MIDPFTFFMELWIGEGRISRRWDIEMNGRELYKHLSIITTWYFEVQVCVRYFKSLVRILKSEMIDAD